MGSGSVVHPGVRIGAGCLIEDLVVLGKRPRLRRGSSAAAVDLGALELSPEVTVCCGAVVYAGAVVGEGSIIGDQAQIREGARVGRRSVVGRASCIDFNATVGDRVSIQTGVYVTSSRVVEDDVFLGPGVPTTNDDTMACRRARVKLLDGPGRASSSQSRRRRGARPRCGDRGGGVRRRRRATSSRARRRCLRGGARVRRRGWVRSGLMQLILICAVALIYVGEITDLAGLSIQESAGSAD